MGRMRTRSTIHLPIEGALTLASLFEKDAAAALDNTLVETRAEVALFVDVLGVAHGGRRQGWFGMGDQVERDEEGDNQGLNLRLFTGSFNVLESPKEDCDARIVPGRAA